MNLEKNGTLQYSLELWANMMGNDFSELRRMWYPASTPGLSGSRVVNDDAWEDLEDSFENSVVLCVEGAVNSLTAAQRGALEHHLGLSAVLRIRCYEERLAEALQKVWLALLSNGCANGG
jgi:hypothetical protein